MSDGSIQDAIFGALIETDVWIQIRIIVDDNIRKLERFIRNKNWEMEMLTRRKRTEKVKAQVKIQRKPRAKAKVKSKAKAKARAKATPK